MKKAYLTLKSKDEFDALIERSIETGRRIGYTQGYKDGRTWVLSYIMELLNDLFTAEDFQLAEIEKRDRSIEEWRKSETIQTLKGKLDWKMSQKERSEPTAR